MTDEGCEAGAAAVVVARARLGAGRVDSRGGPVEVELVAVVGR